MRRTFFMLGGLTGGICAIALFLKPQPAGRAGAGVVIATATYRMAGDVRKNTCTHHVQWPAMWSVGDDELRIGKRRIYGRRLDAAVVFEATRLSDDGCLRADWRIKLAPRGAGIGGTAAWEIAPTDGAACQAPDGVPCIVEADVYGLPQPPAEPSAGTAPGGLAFRR